MKKERRAKHAAEAKADEVKAKDDGEKDRKRARRLEVQAANSNAMKASAMMQMADTESMGGGKTCPRATNRLL